MAARIFVTGGTGFVGSAIIKELQARAWSINLLVNHRPAADVGIRSIRGTLFDTKAVDEGLQDCGAVIHLVGIIAEKPSKEITFDRIHYQGTKAIVDACKRVGVKRYLQMSALGTRANAACEYHRTKYKAEEYLGASGLDWTIIRPSLIHGPQGDFMRAEARWARGKAAPFIAMPYFGAGPLGLGGAGLLQPVYVKDVARAFADALENPNTISQTYELGGSQQLTWRQLHEAVAKAVVGHERWVLPFPAPLAKFFAAIGLGKLLGFNRDQVIMSQEDNICDLSKFKNDFGWMPQSFEETMRNYASEL